MKRALFITAFLLLFRVVSAQQQVQVLINSNPPYSAYLQDYAGAGQQLQIRLINTTGGSLEIRLQGSVTGDNGVSIRTLPNYRPPVPLVLPAGTTLLTRRDLEGLFDLNQISVDGMDKNLLYQGKPLPEGDYQVCVQVYDNRTSQMLSAGEPLGCSPPFPVRAIEPPMLISPLCDGEVLPTTPQATVFTWTPPAGILPTQVSYTLRVVELPLSNVDPNVFIDAINLPPSGIEIKNLSTSTFLYGPSYLPLKLGKRYAWRVQAIDKFGRLNLLNDGKSPACAFQYGSVPETRERLNPYLTITKPTPGRAKQLATVEVGTNNPFSIAWEIDKGLETSLRKAYNAQPGKTLFDRIASLNYRVRIRAIQNGKPGAVVLDRQVRTPYLELERSDLPTGMSTGRIYRAEVELVGIADNQRRQANLSERPLAAEPRSFLLVASDKGDPADSLTVTGILAYRYPGESGGVHALPNTKVVLMKVYPNNYRENVAYGQSDAAGNYRIQVLRSRLHSADTTQTFTRCLVDAINPFIQPIAEVGSYYQTNNQNTFQIARSEIGPYQVSGVSWLASGYQLSVTASQSFQNWPGVPDVNLAGQYLVLYRKPGKANDYDKYRLPVEGQVEKYRLTDDVPVSGGSQSVGKASPVVSMGQQQISGIGLPSLPAEMIRKEVESLGYEFIGLAPLQQNGTAYGTTFNRLIYAVSAFDTYMIYCPGCGQKPQDADPVVFLTPKGKLATTPARIEKYAFNIQTNEAPTAVFRGRLFYKFADPGKDGANSRPLASMSVRLQVIYQEVGSKKMYVESPPPGLEEFHKTFSQTLGVSKTNSAGEVTFTVKMTKPLPLGKVSADYQTPKYSGDILLPGESVTKTGTYIRTLRVLVDNSYYAYPIEDFGNTDDEKINLQTPNQLGDLTAKVRSFNLAIQLRSDTTGTVGAQKQKAGIQQNLFGINVYVLRRPGYAKSGSGSMLPPADEGQGLTETYQYNGVNYPVVAKGKTAADGKVNFSRMVIALSQDDAYLIATESGISGLNNYGLVSLKSMLVSERYLPDYLDSPTQSQQKEARKLNWVNCYTPNGALVGSVVCNYWLNYRVGDGPVNSQYVIGIYSNNAQASLFADQYTYTTSDLVQRYLQPGDPTINLRVVDKTNPTQGLKNAWITLTYDEEGYGKRTKFGLTGPDGWLLKPFELKPGKNASMVIEKAGYCYYDSVANQIVADNKIKIGDLMLGQNSYFDRLLMQPNTIIMGRTVDADNKAIFVGLTDKKQTVEAYVQVDNGYLFKTFRTNMGEWRFNVDAPSTADSLKIFPVNRSYFGEQRHIKTQLPKPVTGNDKRYLINAGDIVVYERDHRINFQILDALTNNGIGGATVKLFGKNSQGYKFGPSNTLGLIETKFKNISVENLFVEVSSPGYVTRTVSVTNVETKTADLRLVALEPARTVTGIVVVASADGKETPLEGVEVFVPSGSNTPVKYSTRSGKGGVFSLDVSKTFDGSMVPVEASYDKLSQGSLTTYVGASSKQSIPQAKGESLKLTLTTFTKFRIATLWGFPVNVEKLDTKTMSVTGEVDLTNPALGPFALLDSKVKVRFKNVVFKANPDNPEEGIPASETVELETGLLDNLVYHTTAAVELQNISYNVRLTSPDGQYGKLKIVRTPGKSTGTIMAQAQIIDNSFNFSAALLSYEKGQFFLYDPAINGQPGTKPVLTAFDASLTNIKWTHFGIAQKDGQPMKLKLLGFDAVSQLDGSRLVGDEIHLNPTMTCTIKDANPSKLTVTIGDLVLKNNTVDAKTSQTPLTFNLGGTWSVAVRNWQLDYKQGGFYATEGIVKTGKVDVPIKLFNLRSDFFKLEVEPKNNFELAGIAQLKLGGKAYFGYDAQTGSDMKGHWSVVVVPDGNSAAAILPAKSVPGLSQDLTFATLSLLDNGEDVVSFGSGSQAVNYFNIIDVRPVTIETGTNYFAFDAGMSARIPNAPQDVPMRFIYSRPNGGAVKLKTIVPGGYKFETKGYLGFDAGKDVAADGSQSTALYFADGIMAIRGKAEEPDKLLLNDVLLVHTNGYTHITHNRNLDLRDEAKLGLLRDNPADIIDSKNDANYYTESGSFRKLSMPIEGSRELRQLYCHQAVSGGQWGLMTFSGLPKGFDMLAEQEQNRLSFTAYGEIRADNQQIKLDGIDTGMGGLSLVYDRREHRFTGTLAMSHLPVPPTMTFSGIAQVRLDGKGFYLVASGNVQNVPLIVPVDMKGGLMLGFYDSQDLGDANAVLFANSHRKALPCAFAQRFKGFYVTGEIPVPIIGEWKEQKSLPGVGEYKLGLDAYADGYLFGNYSSGNWSYGSGLGVGAHAYAYGRILVVEASGEVHINGAADAVLTANPGDKSIALTLGMQLNAGFLVNLKVDPPGDLLDYSTETNADFCLKLGATAAYRYGEKPAIKPDVSCTFDKCTGGCATNDQ
ncbi:hypothetical protein WBJ53_30730 [Spirosoma sp. SC4-14]|uniref:hypothetical protein n=1 Tax=Spirosoma sp. SC4-14 TaxID=3128900 RepID=UPI0030CD824D